LFHVCCNCAQFERLLGEETEGFLFTYQGAAQNTHGEYTNYQLGLYEPVLVSLRGLICEWHGSVIAARVHKVFYGVCYE
jgi:hypothetical protein